jgi:hypothetical protein
MGRANGRVRNKDLRIVPQGPDAIFRMIFRTDEAVTSQTCFPKGSHKDPLTQASLETDFATFMA